MRLKCASRWCVILFEDVLLPAERADCDVDYSRLFHSLSKFTVLSENADCISYDNLDVYSHTFVHIAIITRVGFVALITQICTDFSQYK